MSFSFASPLSRLKQLFQQTDPLAGALNVLRFRYTNYIPGKLFTSWQKKLILKSCRYQLHKYIQLHGKPDLIQQHYIINAQPWIIDYLSSEFNIPYVLFEHSPSLSESTLPQVVHAKLSPFFTTDQLLTFAQNAALRIARTERYKELYATIFQCEFVALPSFVKKEYEELPLPSFPKPTAPFVFFALGDLIKRKAFDRLIRAFAMQFDKTPDVHLKIAGDGPLYASLQTLIVDLKLADRVTLLGLISKQQVFEEMNTAHAVVISSDAESFGNTLIEAMFKGLPVVSTRCGGPEEIVTTTNGLLCEKNDKDLARNMRTLYDQYESYVPEKIIAQAKENYAESKVLNRLLTHYKGID